MKILCRIIRTASAVGRLDCYEMMNSNEEKKNIYIRHHFGPDRIKLELHFWEHIFRNHFFLCFSFFLIFSAQMNGILLR